MPSNKSAYNEAIRKASNAAWDRRWETAIRDYRRAIAEFPEDAAAHSGLALALQESNRLDEALSEYRLLCKIQPLDPVPLAKSAALYERMGRKGDAVTAYLQLAEMYARETQMNKAVEAWKSASVLEPERIEPHERLAAAFSQAGHGSTAAREFVALAKLAQQANDLPVARNYAGRALELDPENTQAKYLQSELQGHPIARLAQPGDSPVELARKSVLSRLASSVLDEHSTRERRIGGSQGSTTDVEAIVARAIDLQQRGQTADAIGIYEQLLSADVARTEVRFNLGLLYQSISKHDRAIELLTETVRDQNYALASHFALGQSMRAQGRLDQAVEHYVQAMKIVDLSTVSRAEADQVIRLYEALADSYRAQGDQESAERFTQTLIQFLSSKGWEDQVRNVRRHIESVVASGTPLSMAEVIQEPEANRIVELLTASNTYFNQGKLYAAGDLAFQSIELAPDYLPAHAMLAEIAVRAGNIREAQSKYDNLAETASVRGDLPKAIAFYRQAVKLGDDAPRQTKLIDVLVRSGQLPEALFEYDVLGQGLERVGQTQAAVDRYTEGLELARRAGAVGANVERLRQHLADAYVKIHDWNRALLLYQEINLRHPEDDKARYYLIDLNRRVGSVSESDNELDSLLEHYADSPPKTRAVLTALAQSFPDDLDLNRRLAAQYLNAGDREKAIEVMDAVGDRLLSHGKREEAMAAIQEIIAMNPPQVEEYTRLLNEVAKS